MAKKVPVESEFNINEIPTASEEKNTIDPLAIPTVENKPKKEVVKEPKEGSSKLLLYIGIGIIAFIVIIIILVLILNSGNKLVCEKVNDAGTKNQRLVLRFDNDDIVKSASVKIVEDVSKDDTYKDYNDEQLDSLLESLKSGFNSYYDNVQASRNGKLFTVTYDLRQSNLDSYGKQKEKVKKSVEDFGYTCK